MWKSLLGGLCVLTVVGNAQTDPPEVAEDGLKLEPSHKVIAVVRDGPSPYFDQLVRGFQKELETLAAGQYLFEIRDRFNAGGDPAKVDDVLRAALADGEVDVVYAAGITASSRAADLAPEVRSKPIVAGAIEFSDFNSDLIGPSGGSLVPNYTFIVSPRRVLSDLEVLGRLSESKVIHVFLDEAVRVDLPEDLNERIRAMEQNLGIDLRLHRAGNSVATALANLPKGAQTVYFPILPSFSQKQRVDLLERLTKRGVMTFSMVGRRDVEAGAFAALAGDNRPALLRRTALNLHQILSGISTAMLPVVLNTQDRLVINMRTAKAIGWSPDYDTTIEADFLHRDAVVRSSGTLSLETALARAAKNPQLLAAQAQLQAEAAQIGVLKSTLRPQLSITGNTSHQRTHDIINPISTPRDVSTGSFGAQVSQVLYSDQICSAIKAQAQVAEATAFDAESVRLDAILSAATAYFSVLEAEALYEIEHENLGLIQSNLQLAKLRREIGASEASEIYRWQASEARAKANLIQRDAQRRTARVQLNVVTSSPREAHWNLDPITIAEGEMKFMDAYLKPLVTDLNQFNKFVGFLQKLAVWQAPELASFNKTLRAQGILLQERSRRNFMPEVQLTLSARRFLQDLPGSGPDGQNEWTAGIGFTIPLFEGGEREAEMTRIQAVIRQIAAQRKNAIYLVEQNALSSAYAISASHPNLRLSRAARAASEKNFEAVRSKYSLGAVPIISLLDAQSDLLTQKQAEASAVYAYLSDIYSLQRAIAWFEFTKSAEQKRVWVRQLKNFMQSGSIHVGLETK